MSQTDDWKPSGRQDLVDLFADALDTHESRKAERDAKTAADQKTADDAAKKDDKTPPKRGLLGWLLGE